MHTTAPPFADLPRTARGHLALRFYEAVLALLAYAEGRASASDGSTEPVLKAHPFLGGYLAELQTQVDCGSPWREAHARLRERVEAWESEATAPLPLRTLARELGLGAHHLLALLLAGMVEEDARFGAVFAAAQGTEAARRPTVTLLHRVVSAVHAPLPLDAWALCRPLVDAGLAEVPNPDDPQSEWRLRVPVPLWGALRGEIAEHPAPGLRWHPAADFRPVESLVLGDREAAQLTEVRALLATGSARTLVVRGLPGSERLELVGAVARALGRGVLEATPGDGAKPDRWKLLGPLATLLRAVPVFVLELGPGEVFEIPEWGGYAGPLGVVAGQDGGLSGPAAERAVPVVLPPEPPSVRARHWARALPGAPAETHTTLADTYTLGGRYVRRAAELAASYAALDGRPAVSPDDVRVAARSINRQQLDALAARLEDGGGWEGLVLHPSTAAELRHLERRCRQRERLAEAMSRGFPGGINRGVRALFHGPSGTGKTLAARVLASVLGLDLYRVDLSSIVNKYIGETEKNLARVLARAEDLDVVLLLDEGDSLMGKRTAVRSSNDRWANLETNYLLQRLDTYTGVVLVTTNAPSSVDGAFQRRMDAAVGFHRPDAGERWNLWRIHLPADHAVRPETLQDAASRFQLTGGQIRNAAIHAAVLALSSTSGRLGDAELLAAVEVEYRKAGASYPGEAPAAARHEPAMSAFLSAIS